MCSVCSPDDPGSPHMGVSHGRNDVQVTIGDASQSLDAARGKTLRHPRVPGPLSRENEAGEPPETRSRQRTVPDWCSLPACEPPAYGLLPHARSSKPGLAYALSPSYTHDKLGEGL